MTSVPPFVHWCAGVTGEGAASDAGSCFVVVDFFTVFALTFFTVFALTFFFAAFFTVHLFFRFHFHSATAPSAAA